MFIDKNVAIDKLEKSVWYSSFKIQGIEMLGDQKNGGVDGKGGDSWQCYEGPQHLESPA